MYIAMNRFTVNQQRADEFIEVWKTRERNLKEFNGYITFKLLQGDAKDGKITFCSHATWTSEESFMEWVNSPQFKQSHSKKRMPEGVLLGPPQFEGYQVVISED